MRFGQKFMIEIGRNLAERKNRVCHAYQNFWHLLPQSICTMKHPPPSMTNAQPIVLFENVTFSYEGGRPVLEQASFEITKNDAIAIIGPNGGGKTTLLKLILGLETPDSGKIQIFGKPPREACELIGYVPQHLQFDRRFPLLVSDVVAMGRLQRFSLGFSSKADREEACFALERVGMADARRRPFAALSGGQRQRVLIARALATRPKLILLDEPMANVDHRAEAEFRHILQELGQDMLVLLVSHDLGFAHESVKHVLCVNRNVHLHPTSSLDGQLIESVFGQKLRIVRHDTDCPDGSHVHCP